MKNERRQKKTQNDLAQILENGILRIKPHSATIMRSVMIILIFVLLFFVGQRLVTGNKTDFYNDVKQLTAFNMLTSDAEQFENVVKEYTTKYPSGVNHAHVSLLIGNLYFNKATDSLNNAKRNDAVAGYEKALEFYTAADNFHLKQQDLAENAVWGIAQANEALASLKEGDFQAVAIAQYERLCETWPDGVYKELAAEQLQLLQRPGMNSFMREYRNSNPSLFAPDMQTTDNTSPGGLDTTITPGNVDFGSMFSIPENNESEIEFEPGLTVLDSEKPTTEPQEPSQPDETPEDAETKARNATEMENETKPEGGIQSNHIDVSHPAQSQIVP